MDYDEKIMMARNAFLDRPSVSFRCMDIARELPEEIFISSVMYCIIYLKIRKGLH